jgi:pimeloyl-ACP methyl ester carboxylesterase
MAPHFFTASCGLQEIAKATENFLTGGLRERMAKYHSDPEGAFFGWNGVWLGPGFRGWDITDVIDHIRVPILAVQGQNDQYGTLAQIDVLAQRTYAPVDQCVLDCRHAPHLEAAEETLAAIASFIARLRNIGWLAGA